MEFVSKFYRKYYGQNENLTAHNKGLLEYSLAQLTMQLAFSVNK